MRVGPRGSRLGVQSRRVIVLRRGDGGFVADRTPSGDEAPPELGHRGSNGRERSCDGARRCPSRSGGGEADRGGQ